MEPWILAVIIFFVIIITVILVSLLTRRNRIFTNPEFREEEANLLIPNPIPTFSLTTPQGNISVILFNDLALQVSGGYLSTSGSEIITTQYGSNDWSYTEDGRLTRNGLVLSLTENLSGFIMVPFNASSSRQLFVFNNGLFYNPSFDMPEVFNYSNGMVQVVTTNTLSNIKQTIFPVQV